MNLIRQNLKEDLARDHDLTPKAPTVWEALRVKRLLGTFPLPLELIELIMDFAEYWPCIGSKMRNSVAVLNSDNITLMDFNSAMFTYHHWVPEATGEHVLLTTEPLGYNCPIRKGNTGSWTSKSIQKLTLKAEPTTKRWVQLPTRGNHPCRRIVFSIVSREDCSSRAPSSGSPMATASWFEAGRERAISPDSLPGIALAKSSLESDSGYRRGSVQSSKSPKSQPNIFRSVQALWRTKKDTQREPSLTTEPRASSGVDHRNEHLVCRNEPATKVNMHHIIEWRYDSKEAEGPKTGLNIDECTGADFVKSLEVGHCVYLRAKVLESSVPCLNYIASARVHIYWAV